MYPQHIQEAAAAMGRTLTESATPLYGSGLRLPDRRAVIDLVKEVRRLLFPAYFGDPALMSLAPENYAALLLERSLHLRRQAVEILVGGGVVVQQVGQRLVVHIQTPPRSLCAEVFCFIPFFQNRSTSRPLRWAAYRTQASCGTRHFP